MNIGQATSLTAIRISTGVAFGGTIGAAAGLEAARGTRREGLGRADAAGAIRTSATAMAVLLLIGDVPRTVRGASGLFLGIAAPMGAAYAVAKAALD